MLKEKIRSLFKPVPFMTAILFSFFLQEPIVFLNDLAGCVWWLFRKPQSIKTWMQVDSGNEDIPAVSREIRELLRKRHILEYSLSPSFYKTDEMSLWVLGRTRSFTWPARVVERVPIVVFKEGDKLLVDCTMFEKGKEVYLAQCK